MNIRIVLSQFIVGTCLLIACSIAGAAGFPDKQVRIVTALSAGSGPDAMLRLVADKLRIRWNQPVIVDNRPGGAGFIAIAEARKSAADGYTLLHIDGLNVTAMPHMYKKLPYDAQADIEPITLLHGSVFFIAVSADSPWKSTEDLINAAKKNPGKVSYGSWQVGGLAHLYGAAFEEITRTKMIHVPFKDMTMLYSSVARGDVDWAFASVPSAGALEKAGKVKFLAIAGPAREQIRPNVPTVAESGGPAGFVAKGWVGLFSTKGTPKVVAEQISADVAEVLKAADVQAKMAEFGYAAMAMKPDQAKGLIQRESRAFRETISKAAIELE